MEDALLFRRLATLDTSAPVSASVDDLEWTGPRDDFRLVASVLDAADLEQRAAELAG
jgi:hypothetical protein